MAGNALVISMLRLRFGDVRVVWDAADLPIAFNAVTAAVTCVPGGIVLKLQVRAVVSQTQPWGWTVAR
jgi:hypothetical protein